MSTQHDQATAQAAEADLELTRRVLDGESAARAEFARRMKCVPRILSVINARRGAQLTAHDLEDLTQDTLVRILEKLETFAGHTTLDFWAHRFCYLETMNRVRRQGRRAAVVASGFEGDVESDARETPNLDSGELEEWLARMDSREADVVRLKLFEQVDYPEIGRRLDVPAATAKSRYYRGITWLQQRLGAGSKDDS
jgi:RNA polymerase sigma-70 factor (ECF subfamily)